jgi:hypothetical protein
MDHMLLRRCAYRRLKGGAKISKGDRKDAQPLAVQVSVESGEEESNVGNKEGDGD